jgi:hypothetical protein
MRADLFRGCSIHQSGLPLAMHEVWKSFASRDFDNSLLFQQNAILSSEVLDSRPHVLAPAEHRPGVRGRQPSAGAGSCRCRRRSDSGPGPGENSGRRRRRRATGVTYLGCRARLASAERLDRSPGGPGPGDLTALRAGPVLLTLTAHTEQVTTSGAVPRRIGTDRSGTEHPGGIRLSAPPSGWADAPGREPVREKRDGPRLTASSRPGPPAGRRRTRRSLGSLPAVRNATQGRGPLDGRRGERGRS